MRTSLPTIAIHGIKLEKLQPPNELEDPCIAATLVRAGLLTEAIIIKAICDFSLPVRSRTVKLPPSDK